MRPSTATGIWNATALRQERSSDTTCAFNLRGSESLPEEPATYLRAPSTSGDKQPKLRVGWHDPCKERRREQRRKPRCRRARLQVAHIRLERRTLRSLFDIRATRD